MKTLLWLLMACALADAQYRVKAGDRIIELPIEDYVAAVVTGESGLFRSDEARKAMAVAARTYAARMRGRHSNEGYDFCDTTHCQRFVSPSSALSIAAARATAGIMLWFDDRPALALYSRSCGGRTESVSGTPYLIVHADPYCKSDWAWSASGEQIVHALRSSDLKTPPVLETIAIVSKTASGRAQTLSLSGQGTTQLISASSFRFAIGRALGWNTLRSELFEVAPGFVFHGSGEGHGIGLCQRGAEAMGLAGKSYQDILTFYYPHTSLFQWTRLAGEHIALFSAHAQSDQRILDLAERIYQALAVPWPKPGQIELRIYPTLDAFRNATAEPGWVAARTTGTRIEMQPIDLLQRHGALESTIRHELTHASVESAAKPGLPVWFREGIVEWLMHPSDEATPAASGDLDGAIRQRQNQSTAIQSYAQAHARVAGLVHRYGRTVTLSWVTEGLPTEIH